MFYFLIENHTTSEFIAAITAILVTVTGNNLRHTAASFTRKVVFAGARFICMGYQKQISFISGSVTVFGYMVHQRIFCHVISIFCYILIGYY